MNPFEDWEQDSETAAPIREDLIFNTRKLDHRDLLRRSKGPNTPAVPSSQSRTYTRVAANNHVLLLATSEGTLIRWNLDNGVDEIEISRRPEDAIEGLYLDPTSYHCVISLRSGENFYLHANSNRPKKLSKLNGAIESLAFDKFNTTEVSTKSFLVGTKFGKVYEISVDSNGREKTCQMVYQLDQSVPITSLHFDVVYPDSERDNKMVVLMATASPMRLYHFVGGPTFSQLFSDYTQSGTVSFTDLPGPSLPKVVLHCAREKQRSQTCHRFAIMTKLGIYHGSLLFPISQNKADSVVLEAQLTPFVSSPTTPHDNMMSNSTISEPLAIASTDFHFLLLRKDRVQAISRLNGALVEEFPIRREDGFPRAIVRDECKNSIFLCTESSVFQVTIQREDRFVWSIFLDKASSGEEKYFDAALTYCQSREQQRQVLRAQAEFFLSQSQYEKAALHLAKSGVSFDEAVLSIIHTKSKDSTLDNGVVDNAALMTSLRVYLLEVLKQLPASSKSQRTMISTWLCEIFLHEIEFSSLQGKSANSGAKQGNNEADLVNQFKEFIRGNKTSLDIATTWNLLSSRNQRPMLLFFAKMIGDYDRVVAYYLTEGSYNVIINLFVDAPFEKVENLIYKVSPLLFEFEPEATVHMLIGKPRLQISKILPAILRYCEVLDNVVEARSQGKVVEDRYEGIDKDFEGAQVNYAIRYLQEIVVQANEEDFLGTSSESACYHCLVWLLAKYDDKEENELCALLQGLLSRKEAGLLNPSVDLEYILRECRRHQRVRAVVYAHLLLGMEEEAVSAALSFDIDLAKAVATRILDEGTRRNLWIRISRHIIESEKDVRQAISLLTSCQGAIKIEDLLPFLPDFTELDVFKDEICTTLEAYSTRIENLKTEMNDLSESAESIVQELEGMKKRGYTTSSHQRCDDCGDLVFSRQFYLFPCAHAFHSDCLSTRVGLCLDTRQSQALQSLKDQMVVLSTRVKDGDKRAMAQLESLQDEIDGFVAGDCPLCGYLMIKSLATPLVSNEDVNDAKSWEI